MSKILNIEIQSINKNKLLQELTQGVVITPNIDHLVKLQKDKELYQAYQQAEWIICDSKILYFLSKILPNSLQEAIPGSSFFEDFYNYHKNDENCRIFLLGAAKGVADKARERINQKINREIIVGSYSPSYGFEKNPQECEDIIQIIKKSRANVLVVGVGAPKQEIWITKYRKQMPNINILMGLGATIDFEAGTLKRAPKIWQKIGMEWLYRCIKEPKRLFKRYFIDDMKFFYYFGKQLIGIYKDPFAQTCHSSKKTDNSRIK